MNVKVKNKCSKFLRKCKAECCGPVPISIETFRKHKKKIKGKFKEIRIDDNRVIVTRDVLTCAFLSKNYKCLIYEDRPWLCQKFGDGSSLLMTCRFFSKSNFKN